eukprot:GHVN01045473.1.p1 GENE.GHVN01045473.1~~GHVN01045473.1.p1  ORF type:complete len:136 (+),score=16.07 GHVN01045473.1:137-544(+)
MVLPFTLLRTSQNQQMMVELKNGETYNGRLVACDGFMNLHMAETTCTSRDGQRFWKIPECFIRGNNIKYLRFNEEVFDMAVSQEETRGKEGRGRGEGHHRGRGRGMRGRGASRGSQSGGGRGAGRGRGVPPQQAG